MIKSEVIQIMKDLHIVELNIETVVINTVSFILAINKVLKNFC